MTKLSENQLAELRKLEQQIFDCGIDGGESTSEAIDALHDKERAFGVFDEKADAPRWVIQSDKSSARQE